MSAKFPVKIVFQAVDNLTGTVKGINDKIAKATQPTRILGKKLGSLGYAMNLKGVGEAFGNVNSAASKLRGEIAGAALAATGLVATVVGGSFALVKGFAESADNISETAERLGISTTALQGYRYAAKIAGVDQEGFDKGLEKLGEHLAQASVGMGDALPVFQALGIQSRDASGKVRTLESVLPELANKFSQIGSESVKNALAIKIFGKEGSKMSVLLSQGAAGIEKMRAEAESMGAVMSADMVNAGADFGDTLDKIGMALAGVRNLVAAELLPVFKDLAGEFFAFIRDNRADFVSLGQAIKLVLVEVVGIAKAAFGGLIAAAKAFNALPVESKLTLIKGALVAFAAIIAGPVIGALWGMIAALGSLAATLLTNPFGLLMVAITAVIGLGYLLIKNWDTVKSWFLDNIGEIGNVFLALMGPVGWLIGAGIAVVSNWSSVKEWFVTLWTEPTKAFDEFVGYIAKRVGAIASLVKGGFGALFGFGGGAATPAISGALAGGDNALTAMAGAQVNRSESRVSIDIANLPRGSEVRTDKGSSKAMDLNLGFAGVF